MWLPKWRRNLKTVTYANYPSYGRTQIFFFFKYAYVLYTFCYFRCTSVCLPKVNRYASTPAGTTLLLLSVEFPLPKTTRRLW